MLIAMAVYVLAIPALACHAAGYDLGDSAFAWARPPLAGPGGSGLRIAPGTPDEAAIEYIPAGLRTALEQTAIGVLASPALFGCWGTGRPPDTEADAPFVARGLSLIRQVLRVDALSLAGRGRVYPSPDGWYPPVEGTAVTPRSGRGDPDKDWLGRDIGSPVTVVAYAWPIVGELVLGDGRTMTVTGRAVVQGTMVALALRISTPETPRTGLAHLVPHGVLAWPEGLAGAAGEAERELAGGWEWTQGWETSGKRLNWLAARSWPFTASCWSDGQWVVLAVLTRSASAGYAGVAQQIQLEESPDWPGVVASSLPYRPEPWPLLGLGPQTPDLMLGPVPDVIRPAPDLTPTVERCVATLPPEARAVPPPPLTAWKEARVGPAPALVERYLERLDLPESVTLSGDTPDGRRAMGVLRTRKAIEDFDSAHLWWTLGRDCLTVTVLPWLTGEPMWKGLEKRFDAEQDSALLTGLFGWRGRSISVVPSTMGPVGDSEWVSLVPDPNHEVGLLERVRVGQTEWGRCRVYKGYHIYHIVFDLLPEDVADR